MTESLYSESGITPQRSLLGAPLPRRSPKWCNRCSSRHVGPCRLVKTAHGTWCRPEIRTVVEKREALRRMQRA